MFGHQLVQWTLLAITAATSQPAPQEQWEQVREQIRRKSADLTSLREETLTTTSVFGDPDAEVSVRRTTEASRRVDGSWLWRTEIRMKIVEPGAGGSSEEDRALMLHDGRFVYTITQDGDKRVARSIASAHGEDITPEDPLASLEQVYDLHLVGAQDLDSWRAWIVEARLRTMPR